MTLSPVRGSLPSQAENQSMKHSGFFPESDRGEQSYECSQLTTFNTLH